MTPDILEEIVAYLKKYNLNLVQGNDARINSAASEQVVISALQNASHNKWKVITPNVTNNRAWYDFICKDNKTQQKYYCDIKISNCESNDNMNAKKAIYWLLTGDKNTEEVPNQNNKFFEKMKKNENLTDRDFYYLVINKKELNDIFIVSLKNINSAGIIGSVNNPPFQANWSKCKIPENKTMVAAKDFFLKEWAGVIKRNIRVLEEGMPVYYPKYFK